VFDLATILLLASGLGLLIGGADVLVRGASRLATAIGLSPLVVGLTVVAFGTSAPELAVSLQAAFRGDADIAVANVVGSNIFNVLFILGASASIAPLVVSQQLVRLDVPIMVGISLAAFALASDGRVGVLDGLLLASGAIGYTLLLARLGRREAAAAAAEAGGDGSTGPRSRAAGASLLHVAYIVAGLGLLVLGSRWFVDGAISLARVLGVSEVVVGLTIVAGGTSLPEVATSVVAAIRGERDIAVGNVVGSNIYNLLLILGVASLATPGGLAVPPSVLTFDLPVMVVVAIACLPVFFTDYTIARWEGLLFFAYYVAYTTYLVLYSARHDALPAFSFAMLWFALPITALTLIVVAMRQRRAR
jgi:cation:H+ antiporter